MYNLKKFDPVEIGKPSSTPIQKSPYGFPNLANQPVTIIKCKFRYPATEPMIQQMAQLLGYNINYVRVVDTKYDDGIDVEMKEYENEMKKSPLLLQTELGSEDGAKEAAKAYGNSYLDSIKDQVKDSKMNIPYVAEKTKDSFDPFKPYTDDQRLGDKSPLSKIKRPNLPKTGAR